MRLRPIKSAGPLVRSRWESSRLMVSRSQEMIDNQTPTLAVCMFAANHVASQRHQLSAWQIA